MCGLRVQPWRVGLHTICHKCEVQSLLGAIEQGCAPWHADEATLEAWFNNRQASAGVREGLEFVPDALVLWGVMPDGYLTPDETDAWNY